jgi:hypothetical protein
MPKFSKDDPNAHERALQGRARMNQISDETKGTIKGLVDAMLAGLRQQLGREPTMIDEMDATALCALSLQAAKLRAKGQSELEVWREYVAVRDKSVWAVSAPPVRQA